MNSISVPTSYALKMAKPHRDMGCATNNTEKTSNKKRYSHPSVSNVAKVSLVLFVVFSVNISECKENKTNSHEAETLKQDIAKRMRVIESVTGRFFSDVYENGTFRTGNLLWDNILNKCTGRMSVGCLQKNVYSYLDDSLKYNGDIYLGHGVCFKKNNVDVSKYSKEANIIYLSGSHDKSSEGRYLDEENEIDDEEEPESPFEEVTDALYDKGIKFLVTHDMKLTLPEFFFEGATLKVSPRALTKTGALVHIDLEPRADTSVGQGRLFFHKIKKYVRKKLLTAAIAIILVIKLIALKLVFVLPLIMGVTTAKKMFLKFLLFLFPALSHIFKLCSWYHQNYHTTKYHHHHHLITHHHKPQHSYGHPSSSVVVRPHAEGPPPSFDHYPQDWELSGPGLGNEYVASGISGIHRNAIANFKPDINDANDINAWGLAMPPGHSQNVGEYASTNNVPQVAPPNTGQRINLANSGRPIGPANPYRNKKNHLQKDALQLEKEALIRAASLAARAPPSPVRDEILRVSAAKLTETNRVKTETELVKQQQQILAAQDPETVAAEKFYGALLDRVDKILTSIGAGDPGCRDRAVCALYRDPFRHAPYSNLVSNELSKDSSELLPPADSKMALLYYNYVQAARDGQEHKDCIALYPHCNVEFK
ncbi:unnamed protein product [Chilo suppressalis]|uniref:Uncharacterized protein n=1 Tax=Chilo suppressalis TaxID=168631 RepID=A0ABN8EDS9_CHISP|nr:hypothetical protein evm_011487 [Chilo suppressalis]CAH0683915.1 unnamed protein product [Chilo suppressalis]